MYTSTATVPAGRFDLPGWVVVRLYYPDGSFAESQPVPNTPQGTSGADATIRATDGIG